MIKNSQEDRDQSEKLGGLSNTQKKNNWEIKERLIMASWLVRGCPRMV
jgi:hypothetical protein